MQYKQIKSSSTMTLAVFRALLRLGCPFVSLCSRRTTFALFVRPLVLSAPPHESFCATTYSTGMTGVTCTPTRRTGMGVSLPRSGSWWVRGERSGRESTGAWTILLDFLLTAPRSSASGRPPQGIYPREDASGQGNGSD